MTPSPVLVGTFQPAASGGVCAAWDATCPRTALQATATRGVWALTLTIPAGDWRWRVAPDGDAADSIGVGTRVDGADVRLQLSGPQACHVRLRRDASRDDRVDRGHVRVGLAAGGPLPRSACRTTADRPGGGAVRPRRRRRLDRPGQPCPGGVPAARRGIGRPRRRGADGGPCRRDGRRLRPVRRHRVRLRRGTARRGRPSGPAGFRARQPRPCLSQPAGGVAGRRADPPSLPDVPCRRDRRDAPRHRRRHPQLQRHGDGARGRGRPLCRAAAGCVGHVRLVGGDAHAGRTDDPPLPLRRCRRGRAGLLRRRCAARRGSRGRHPHRRGHRLGHHRLRARHAGRPVARRCRGLPDLPRPVPERRPCQRREHECGALRLASRSIGPPGAAPVGRAAGPGHREQRVVRGRPGRHHPEPGLPREAGRHRALPEPHLLGRLQPRLRHPRLPPDRPPVR